MEYGKEPVDVERDVIEYKGLSFKVKGPEFKFQTCNLLAA